MADILRSSRDQVRSMAMVHEKLYSSPDLSTIDFREYVHSLVTSLLQSYGRASGDISTELDIEELWLDVDVALPCGLIVNELVSNALKHAFPGERSGQVRVAFAAGAEGYMLQVSDNGIGLPIDAQLNDCESLGLALVRTLVEQLHGTLEVQREKGTCFRIHYPVQRGDSLHGRTV